MLWGGLHAPSLKIQCLHIQGFAPSEDGDYYKLLANQVGLNVLFFDATNVEYTLPSINAFVDFYYSVYHGMFDRTDPNLIGIKERYDGQAISWTMQRLFVVMTKPV